MALEITDQNHSEIVNQNEKPVVMDFWATWCGPCRMIAPYIEEMAQTYHEKAIIGKVNVDENPEVSAKYGIRNIPTVIFLKNGEIKDKVVGAVPKSTLAAKLDALL
ncbi:MAG: thioredoxin [Bacteroidales bacterium]|nr:thioredoxin [Bacteroidales bacterium]HOY38472.1 thioredoxin [Bacteroidales bacterium]HQP04363.1 thioredoxin [Bacteroidales bacterium]